MDFRTDPESVVVTWQEVISDLVQSPAGEKMVMEISIRRGLSQKEHKAVFAAMETVERYKAYADFYILRPATPLLCLRVLKCLRRLKIEHTPMVADNPDRDEKS
jgi:hypothetical protein